MTSKSNVALLAAACATLLSLQIMTPRASSEESAAPQESSQNPLLRHVVLLKFKPTASQQDTDNVAAEFVKLPSKIKSIAAFEWGTNNSPEELNKGFTHCFFVSFKNEAGRAAYLPHPAHQAFVEVLKPHLEDVLVVDYWTGSHRP